MLKKTLIFLSFLLLFFSTSFAKFDYNNTFMQFYNHFKRALEIKDDNEKLARLEELAHQYMDVYEKNDLFHKIIVVEDRDPSTVDRSNADYTDHTTKQEPENLFKNVSKTESSAAEFNPNKNTWKYSIIQNKQGDQILYLTLLNTTYSPLKGSKDYGLFVIKVNGTTGGISIYIMFPKSKGKVRGSKVIVDFGDGIKRLYHIYQSKDNRTLFFNSGDIPIILTLIKKNSKLSVMVQMEDNNTYLYKYDIRNFYTLKQYIKQKYPQFNF